MVVPILNSGDLLIVSIQSTLTDQEFSALEAELVRRVGDERVLGVVMDVSSLDVLDSYAMRVLRATAQAIRLRGAEMIVVGIQPEVAFAMVQLGIRMESIRTALDLRDGVELLKRTARAKAHG